MLNILDKLLCCAVFRARDDKESSAFQDGENQACCLLGCDTVYCTDFSQKLASPSFG